MNTYPSCLAPSLVAFNYPITLLQIISRDNLATIALVQSGWLLSMMLATSTLRSRDDWCFYHLCLRLDIRMMVDRLSFYYLGNM